MKNKFLVASLVASVLAFSPIITFGAYNDVSLGTSAIVSINDTLGTPVSLNVTGTADVVESIIVGASSVTVGLQSGSTVTFASNGRNLITTTADTVNYSTGCSDTQSTLTLTATAAVTTSVSVSANACGASTTTTATGSNGPVAQSGGGGGGGGYIAPTVTTATVATTVGSASPNVQPSVTTSTVMAVFSRALSAGSKGDDVKSLQQVLNSDPDTRVASSGAGSMGKETNLFGPATKAAIQKFQVKYGLAAPGKSGYGVFGPKTRAKVNEIAKNGVQVSAPASTTSSPASTSQSSNTDIAQQIADTLKLIQALQAQIKAQSQ